MSGRHSHLESEDLGSVLCSPQASAEGGEGWERSGASVQGELPKSRLQEKKYLRPLHAHQPTKKVSSCLQGR